MESLTYKSLWEVNKIILVDNSEPEDIVNLLKQSVPVSVMPLNQTHRSDYYFGGEDGKTRQFSRKQAGELLADIDEAEDQLRDYYNNADENYQIIEGLISASPLTRKSKSYSGISVRRQARPSALFSCKVAENGYIYDGHDWNVSSAMYYAWVFSISQAGIVTYYTDNYVGTARLLVAVYRNCQKPPDEHTTLQRYIKPRIYIKEHSPYVETLMGLKGAELGETKAKALIEYFGSPLSLFMATMEEICEVEGFGKKTAEKILNSIGRDA